MRRLLPAGLMLLTLGIPAPGARASQRTPSVKDVMKLVGAYVDAYGERASIVVGTERYTQESRRDINKAATVRRIVAEFAVVKVNRLEGWQGFRDVIEVDGTPLPDREGRLIKALVSGGGYAEARRLSDESARFNIGGTERNFNVPTSTLFFFASESLDRFRFSAKNVEPDGTWRIAFKEERRPTFIRTPSGESIPISGELWVQPEDGAIRRTALAADIPVHGSERMRGTGRFDVLFGFVEAVGMWLPASMDEGYEVRAADGSWERVTGHATYSNYRQFTTSGRIK